MKKGINFLELLFIVFLTLHLAQVQPFGGWKWYVIAIPLFVEVLVRLAKRIWYGYGVDKLVYEFIEMERYKIKYRKEVAKFQKENKIKNV